ncbi:uncharacterized protein LAESUDRAFT_727163 [Laetiporus sulphureus 93-53]|uniref:Uncharacterized protein n=1 Tax=Laetiporus sulphureus 93-53 TaxID=1314785 RepID=A0A165DMR2_9APHY|nr:uncharacterized protein LAESUDRAFT_727163 [Laetiporus sulphureus 93-53]KZT05218.1 hypothetical protein LAESUDRAFT_727163 [Laetiporus sulphureus 93-53]
MAGRGYCVALVVFVIAVVIVTIAGGRATGCVEWWRRWVVFGGYDRDTSRSSFARAVRSAGR